MRAPELSDPPADPAGEPPAPGRTRRNRGSEVVCDALIEAAIDEFATRGFTGASTRRIAETAGAHQSQIRYHFDTKDELWRRAISRLLHELDEAIEAGAPSAGDDETRAVEASIRGLVHFTARRPQLSRIMAHEATQHSDRLSWLVEHHLAARYAAVTEAWSALAERGLVAPIDPALIYHTVIGAAALLHAHGPEAELLGIDPTDPAVVDRQADSLVALFIRPAPDSPGTA